MHKDKSKYDKGYLFSFNNSIKNSSNPTPESSNNVSFQYPFTSSLKSLNTQSFNMLSQSSYPKLFHSSNNKENELWQKISSNRRSNEKSNSKNKCPSKGSLHSSSKKLFTKLSYNDKERPTLIDKTNNILPSMRFDLCQSIPSSFTTQKKINRVNSSVERKPQGSLKREENIKVFVRLKPKAQKSIKEKDKIQILNEQTLKIEDSYYSFDKIFTQDATQESIFQNVGETMCRQLFEGFNGTIFAYGQTGSGKTYTIFGQESCQKFGLIYRCISEILEFNNSFGIEAKIKCSMVELYKEQLIDMFGYCSDLKLKEHKNGEVYIEGLKQIYIKSEKEMMRLVKEAAKGRKVTSTKLNEESSRSHTILTIFLQRPDYTSKLRLIDLAGSQKVCKSGTQGEAFQQTKKINYSLSCLGNVINALTTRNKTQHIPFRDSKLTRILKDSLTGNFLTSVIVNCSSSDHFLHETISSLKFAERAKKIKVNVQSLEEDIQSKETITQLHSIIKKLQYDLDITTNQLNKYKQKEMSSPNNKIERTSNPKKIQINIPINRANKKLEVQPAIKQEERSHSCQSQLTTARNPIPSERACVQENFKRYNQRMERRPIYAQNSAMILPEFSSLNVSKSIRKLENSPDLSSLSIKNDESPDISLSFSIQGQSALRQVILNSPY